MNKEKIDKLFNPNLKECSVCGKIIKKGMKYWSLSFFETYFCSKKCIGERTIKVKGFKEKVQE